MVCTINTIDHTFYPISTILYNDHTFSNLVLLIDLVNICLLAVEQWECTKVELSPPKQDL